MRLRIEHSSAEKTRVTCDVSEVSDRATAAAYVKSEHRPFVMIQFADVVNLSIDVTAMVSMTQARLLIEQLSDAVAESEQGQ